MPGRVLCIHKFFHRVAVSGGDWAPQTLTRGGRRLRDVRGDGQAPSLPACEGCHPYARSLLAGFVVALKHIGEAGGIVQKGQIELADRTVALLGDDDFGTAFEVWVILLVDLLAKDKHNNVGVLLNRPGFAQIGELRPVVAAPAFGSTAELRQGEDGNLEFLGDGFQSARNGGDFLGAVFEALAAAGHELQVVDDQQVEAPLRLFEAAGFGAHFAQRNSGRVIDEQERIRKFLHGADYFLHVVGPERAGAHLVRINNRARTEQALQQGLTRHFEREDADHLAVVDGGILGNVHGESGLAHGRARRENDEVGFLEAAGFLVKIGVVGGEASDALAALQQSVDRAKGVANDLLDSLEALANTLLGQLTNGSFRVIHDLVGGIGLLAGFGDGGICTAAQPAQNSVFADDSDVVLNGRAVGHAVEQSGDVADIADGLQILLLLQLFDQRDDVNGPRRFGQIHHARIDAAVRVDGKVFGLQVLAGVVESVIVEQYSAQDGALGFNVRRQTADGGFESGHDVLMSAFHRKLFSPL